MNAREFMATYKSGPASENTYKEGVCGFCGEDSSHLFCPEVPTEGSDTACSTPSSSGSPESSFSAEEVNFVAGILECLGNADGLWLSRGEILLLIARTKGEL